MKQTGPGRVTHAATSTGNSCNGAACGEQVRNGSIVLSQHPRERIHSEAPLRAEQRRYYTGMPIGCDQGRHSEIRATKGILDFAFRGSIVRTQCRVELLVVEAGRGP